MTDTELMAKYDLSARGLQSAFIKLLNARAITHAEMNQRRAIYHDKTLVQQIDARDIVKDIRSGMTDSELMKKYDLSSEGLRFALQTLTDTEVIALEELYAASSSAYDTVFVENMRELPRHHLSMAVTIYEATRPEVKGTLRDITEKGVGITGISARVGEVKTSVQAPIRSTTMTPMMTRPSLETTPMSASDEADDGSDSGNGGDSGGGNGGGGNGGD